jgi:CTP:molybdopterin cytidylyltransferase MocA
MLACFDDELTFVVSNAPDELGPAGSIAAIVKSGKIDEADELLITPVDMPPISPHIVDQLCSALGSNALAARPVFGSRGGHPVLVRSSLIFDHYRISVPSLRDVLRGPGVGLVDVPVTDPDVIADLDTPEAFRTRRGMEPSFWPQ